MFAVSACPLTALTTHICDARTRFLSAILSQVAWYVTWPSLYFVSDFPSGLDPSHLAYFGRQTIVVLVMGCWRCHPSALTLLWQYWMQHHNDPRTRGIWIMMMMMMMVMMMMMMMTMKMTLMTMTMTMTLTMTMMTTTMMMIMMMIVMIMMIVIMIILAYE